MIHPYIRLNISVICLNINFKWNILIEGTNGDEWIEINYMNTIGATDGDHYFTSNRFGTHKYEGSRDYFKHHMGDNLYALTYDTINTDYGKYSKSFISPDRDIKE